MVATIGVSSGSTRASTRRLVAERAQPGALGDDAGSGMTLRLRNTFIDTSEPERQESGTPRRSFRRSRSAPARGSTPRGANFAPEEAYVEELARKWDSVLTPPHEWRSAADLVRAFFCVEPESPWAHGAGGAGSSEDPQSSAASPATAWCPNDGSLGHPQLCARPCLFFASGACGNGRGCEYCHLSHPQRPPHLERRHRDRLQQMSRPRAKSLIVPIVLRNVREFAAAPEVEAELARLLVACDVADHGAAQVEKPRRDRALVAALGDLSLRLVIASLQRSVLEEHEVEAHQAAEALLAHLRAAARRQGPVSSVA